MNKTKSRRADARLVVTGICILLLTATTVLCAELPVVNPASRGFTEDPLYGVRNVYTVEQLHEAITDGDAKGLALDLAGANAFLSDGSPVAADKVYGTVAIGPYPFEAAETHYAYKRFRKSADIVNGKATLPVYYLLEEKHNSEDWTDRGQLAVRLDLHLETPEKDVALGTYDLFIRFLKVDGGFIKQPGIVEGPFVHMVGSEDPGSVVISFRTDRAVAAKVVVLNGGRRETTEDEPTTRHEISLAGLKPGTNYRYYVILASDTTKTYRFKTPPRPGEGEVVFAYTGDSRQGVGGGEKTFMGLNHQTLEGLAALAYAGGAEFILQGGDLVNGYTAQEADFRTQLYAWKQTLSGFWHERPVYTALGNHEALLRVFKDDSGKTIMLDRWPYATQSAEAVFADELVQPRNGPDVSDPRRPTYKENVFSFRYGPVMVICYNNNYWLSSSAEAFGGSPEGYIMPDQLAWIKRQLRNAEADDTVKYVMLMAQEPVFPCGGHIQDAMWYDGNNNVRAHSHTGGQLRPEANGMIEVRNEFAQALSECSKVAAVLGSDEHAYYRILISDELPVGVPDLDDRKGTGVIGEMGDRALVSPLRSLRYATWYLTSGGAGAPYYSEQPTPWSTYWKETRPENFYYSSQENLMLFRATQERISVTVFNRNGELIDRIADLMSVKQPGER